jgi:hypothetical protein
MSTPISSNPSPTRGDHEPPSVPPCNPPPSTPPMASRALDTSSLPAGGPQPLRRSGSLSSQHSPIGAGRRRVDLPQHHPHARSDGDLPSAGHESNPVPFPPETAKLMEYISMAVNMQDQRALGGSGEKSPGLSPAHTPALTASTPLPSTPPPVVIQNPTPEQIAEADANIARDLDRIAQVFDFVASLTAVPTRPATPDVSPSGQPLHDPLLNVPPIDLSAQNPEPVSQQQATTNTADQPIPVSGAPVAGGANAPSRSSRSSSSSGTSTPAAARNAALATWMTNAVHVVGHEAIAVGLTTGIREVVAGLVRTAQNNAHGTERAQEAMAGAIIALIGVANMAAMYSRRARGTNTHTADAGNVLQMVGLAGSAFGAAKTGQLKDLLPNLTRTVVYASLRDSANTIKPYSPNADAGNALLAQAANTPLYTVNQFAVNWLQSAKGLSGAGFADKLHNVTSTNATEASTERNKILKEAAGQLPTYVLANMGGEVLDKIVGSILEQALGDEGWAGVAHMAIGHDELHVPTASEWGDAMEKTISRMSLFGQALGSSAAVGTSVSPARFGEVGATALDNFVGAASVAVLCLPFVATLMRKARATITTGTGND